MRIRGGNSRILQAAQQQEQREQVVFPDPSKEDGLHHQLGDLVQSNSVDSGLSDRKRDDGEGFFSLPKSMIPFQEKKEIEIKDQEVDSSKINFCISSSFGAKKLEQQQQSSTEVEKKKSITFVSSETSTPVSDKINNITSTASSSSSITAGKKRRSPAVLMEGSRCSRINGRGWRCSQLTLVGYSLCEHHLGKGRLRSVTNNGQLGSSSSNNSKKNITTRSSYQASVEQHDSNDREDEGTLMPVVIAKKKRNKIGVVKARSISSLLDNIDHDEFESVNAAAMERLQQLAEVAGVHQDHNV